MTQTFQLDIVSTEAQIFSGEAEALFVRGSDGDLGIYPGHLQLLTGLPPGVATIKTADEEKLLYVSGGILEVQPDRVTILADVVQRPQDVNEAKAKEARAAAERALAGQVDPKDFKHLQLDLEAALAKLRLVELMRVKKNAPR